MAKVHEAKEYFLTWMSGAELRLAWNSLIKPVKQLSASFHVKKGSYKYFKSESQSLRLTLFSIYPLTVCQMAQRS